MTGIQIHPAARGLADFMEPSWSALQRLREIREQVAADQRRFRAIAEQLATDQQRWRDIVKQAQDSQKRLQAIYGGFVAARRVMPDIVIARYSEPEAKPAQPLSRSDVRIMVGLMGQGRPA